jgi:hypothetical protein
MRKLYFFLEKIDKAAGCDRILPANGGQMYIYRRGAVHSSVSEDRYAAAAEAMNEPPGVTEAGLCNIRGPAFVNLTKEIIFQDKR